MNYFELFSLPVKFNVNRDQIHQVYLDLQRATHPDKYSHSSQQEQRLAMQTAAKVNDAYNVLKDPLRRAEYMLAEQGVDIRMEQQTLQDPAFLMQQMELREELEEAADSADPDAAIESLYQHIDKLRKQYCDGLANLLESNADGDHQQAADQIRKLKFIEKLQVEVERLEESLF